MKIYLLIIFCFLNIIGLFGQKVQSALNKNIELDLFTSLEIKKNNKFGLKSLKNKKEDTLSFSIRHGGIIDTAQNNSFYVILAKKNNGFAIIKDENGKITGEIKEFNKYQIIEVENRTFKLEQTHKIKFEYKLIELGGEDYENNHNFKKIILEYRKVYFDIYHNLDDIPATLIPLLINTDNIDFSIASKRLSNFMNSSSNRGQF